MRDKYITAIKESLDTLLTDIKSNWIFCKEREIVSVYALDHLLPYLSDKKLISRNSQIAIESRVPQLAQANAKSEVCKDLVIWESPYQNCWESKLSSKNYPIVILEFKANTKKQSDYDVDWLKRYTALSPKFLGAAVRIDFTTKTRELEVAFITDGKILDKT